MLSYEEAGRVLGDVSARHVRRLVAERKLRAYKVGRLVKIAWADLVAFTTTLPEVHA
jgi:excisionase family DNA binding protein